MPKTDRIEIIARYAETDMMGIIHHSVYPVWYEAARTEFIRNMTGMSYSELEKKGIMLPLTDLECHYIRPVHYEDRVTIETEIKKLTAARIEFQYRVFVNGELMAGGGTSHGFVSSETFRQVKLKKTEPELFERLEAVKAGGDKDE